jgi:8-oxo-dGTP pyrophosphatase MutT (NUDIX family)
MAVCAFIMDRDKNLLLTKRPEHLKIFPNVWVMPGGVVELNESLETAIMREVEEEVGLTFEYENDDTKNPVRMISPLRNDFPGDFIPMEFEPFYLYESVTNNVLDEVLHLSGYQDREVQTDEKLRPPVSQHLCLFYKCQLDETYDKILMELNKAEVHKLGWVGLDQLAEAF